LQPSTLCKEQGAGQPTVRLCHYTTGVVNTSDDGC